MSPRFTDLSRRERQIMEVIYRLGRASAAEVTKQLPDAPSQTTVRTLLRILEEKGFLSHEKVEKRFIYRPSQNRGIAGKSALARLLAVYFDGSITSAVACHLNDPQATISDDELNAISRMIQEAKRRTRR